MKHLLKYPIIILCFAFLIQSCEKEVNNCGPGKINLPPNANAGDDQKFLLPIDWATLYGGFSSDPDGVIVSYQWTKRSGPSEFEMVNAQAEKTLVKNLVQGIYQFELKIYDECGLYSTDIMEINVDVPTGVGRLLPVGSLSQARNQILTASVGNKILFIGGRYLIKNAWYDSTEMTWWNSEFGSTRVDIYDVMNMSWTESDLKGSTYTKWSKSVTAGNKLYLANGYHQSGKVDVYDPAFNSWDSIELPEARNDMAVVSLGNKIFFAGGNTPAGPSARVDIYDVSKANWSIASLSEARFFLTGTAVGSIIIFEGGNNGSRTTRTVDIFDAANNTWSTGFLNQSREMPNAYTLGTKAIFTGFNYDGSPHSMDIYDINTRSWSVVVIPFGISIENGVSTGQKLLFINSGQVNVYDAFRNTFSLIHLDVNLNTQSVITINDQVYITGDINKTQSDRVWRLQY